ncbi:MAG: dihydrolipoyl dehydrogenase, partial [Spartobacteria bacterium]|nr:dihydrolipoyl dehydrogenase [Spartobacteria bacterium]
ILIIGAGPAGYPAAFRAADLGFQVTLIDKRELPGGVCLHHGCIPTKALLHIERTLAEAHAVSACGVTFDKPSIDLDSLRAWKSGISQKLAEGITALCKQRGITYMQGAARLMGNRQVEVTHPDGRVSQLSAAHILLASGSEPQHIPGLTVDQQYIMDSKSALDIRDIPGRLLVVGGGYIGLELGSVYAALGARVSVCEMMPHLLPGVDRGLTAPLARALAERFEAIMLKTRIVNAEIIEKAVEVTMEGPEGQKQQTFDKVLIAIGRRPVTANLGLEHTAARIDEQGFIVVDPHGQTAEPALFAAGDVAGNPMLAHKATFEGIRAVNYMAGEKTEPVPPPIIPAVVFTTPEIAWCGLTEQQAKDENRRVKICRFPWSASGRALTMGAGNGLTRLVIDSDSSEILGVGITGAGAGELIGEGLLAVRHRIKASDLAATIHPHPTLSETLMEAAGIFSGEAIHVYRKAQTGQRTE